MLCSSRSLVATMQGSSSSASGTNHLRIMGCQCWWKWFWDEVRMKGWKISCGFFSCQKKFSKRYAKEREGLHTKLFAKVRQFAQFAKCCWYQSWVQLWLKRNQRFPLQWRRKPSRTGGKGPGFFNWRLPSQSYSKKNKRQLVSGSIEQLGLKAAHGFLRDQYLQVDGEWWWLGRLDDVRFFGRGWRGFLPGWQRQSFLFLHQSSITATLAMKPPTTSWSPKECLFLVWVAGPTVIFLKMFFW